MVDRDRHFAIKTPFWLDVTVYKCTSRTDKQISHFGNGLTTNRKKTKSDNISIPQLSLKENKFLFKPLPWNYDSYLGYYLFFLCTFHMYNSIIVHTGNKCMMFIIIFNMGCLELAFFFNRLLAVVSCCFVWSYILFISCSIVCYVTCLLIYFISSFIDVCNNDVTE